MQYRNTEINLTYISFILVRKFHKFYEYTENFRFYCIQNSDLFLYIAMNQKYSKYSSNIKINTCSNNNSNEDKIRLFKFCLI